MKHVFVVLFLSLGVLLFPKLVFATISIELSNLPSSVIIDQELTLDVVLTCSGCGISYLKGVFFYPDSSTSYSGYTQNNSGEWINVSGSPLEFFKIDSGSWSGQIKFKLAPDKPAGNYYFKIGRYTASGTSFSQVSTNYQIVAINPSPTATFTPTAPLTVTSSPTPSPTQIVSDAIYKINKSKDENNQTLTSVKIYVDNLYLRHEDDEVLKFCDGCYCDDDKTVACSLGNHTIKLVKFGYSDWSELRNFSAGSNHEINPILTKIPTQPTPSPTTTTIISTLTSTSTPIPTRILTTPVATSPIPSRLSSDSAVLSASDSVGISSTAEISKSPLLSSSESYLSSNNESSRSSYLSLILIGAGLFISSLGFILFRLNILRVKG